MQQRSHSKSDIETGSQSSFFQKKHNDNFFGQSYKPFFNSSFIQAKLTVQQPDEGNEQQADNDADQLSHRSATSFANDDASNHQGNLSIQRKCAECEENGKNDLPVNENTSPEIISRQLGKGKPLNGATQSRMEASFGTEFSNVEIHNDSNAAGLSEKMNARAFTVGKHIAFGTGEYAPGTIEGEGLIAHELAHVVQQNAGVTSSVQQKGNSGYRELETEADNAAADVMVSSWGKSDLENRVSPKKIMPKLKSGLRLQRCPATQKKVVTPTKDSDDMKLIRRFRSVKLESRDSQINQAGRLLGEVGEWADNEKAKQSMPEGVGVVGLAPKQMENATTALALLKANRSLYEVKGLGGVATKLIEANNLARGAKKYIGSSEREHQLLLQQSLIQSGDLLDNAEAALEKMHDSVDGYPLYLDIEKSRDMLQKVKDNKVDQYEGFDSFVEQNKAINAKILEIQTKYSQRPEAIDRIAFLVQYFIAINSPGHAGDPSGAERKKFKGKLSGTFSMDLHEVFGESSSLNFELFITFGNMLDKQLAIREAMAKAGLPDTIIPTQKDISAYFKSLSKKSNPEVITAYQDYAQGFFFHRIVTNLDDMRVTGVSQIFDRKTSITASRPLVCSGYAILGAHLLTQAGGKVGQFISGVRATDDNILKDKFDVGHALAEITRGGQRLWVSNDSIVFSKAAGMSPLGDAGTLYTGTGKTNGASLDSLTKVLAKKKAALQKAK